MGKGKGTKGETLSLNKDCEAVTRHRGVGREQ